LSKLQQRFNKSKAGKLTQAAKDLLTTEAAGSTSTDFDNILSNKTAERLQELQ